VIEKSGVYGKSRPLKFIRGDLPTSLETLISPPAICKLGGLLEPDLPIP